MMVTSPLFRLLAVLMVCCTVAPAKADDTRQLAEQLVALEDHAALYAAANDVMVPILNDMLGTLEGEDAAAFKEIVSALWSATSQSLGPAYVDAVIEIYSKTYTAAELTALISFYTSPVGTSIRTKMPSLSRDLAAAHAAQQMDAMTLFMDAIQQHMNTDAEADPDRQK